MSKLLKHPWALDEIPWTEDDLQMAIVQHLRKTGQPFAADFNAGKRNPGRAKAMGLEAGEPDLRLYYDRGRTVFVELKRQKGVVSAAQKARHKMLRDLGHTVHVLRAKTPAEAVDKIATIIEEANAPI